MEGEEAANRLRVHGALSDGAEYDFELPTLGVGDGSDGDQFVGKRVNGWWVKARVGADYYVSRGDGRKVEAAWLRGEDSRNPGRHATPEPKPPAL